MHSLMVLWLRIEFLGPRELSFIFHYKLTM